MKVLLIFPVFAIPLIAGEPQNQPAARPRKTEVSIRGDQFFLNGKSTYAGRKWNGQLGDQLTAQEGVLCEAEGDYGGIGLGSRTKPALSNRA